MERPVEVMSQRDRRGRSTLAISSWDLFLRLANFLLLEESVRSCGKGRGHLLVRNEL